MTKHVGEQPHTCKQYNYTSTFSCALQIHMMTHTALDTSNAGLYTRSDYVDRQQSGSERWILSRWNFPACLRLQFACHAMSVIPSSRFSDLSGLSSFLSFSDLLVRGGRPFKDTEIFPETESIWAHTWVQNFQGFSSFSWNLSHSPLFKSNHKKCYIPMFQILGAIQG